jgi:hypothetical protein
LNELQRECHEIADLLDVRAVTGPDATKQRALTEMRTATVLHIGERRLEREGIFGENIGEKGWDGRERVKERERERANMGGGGTPVESTLKANKKTKQPK